MVPVPEIRGYTHLTDLGQGTHGSVYSMICDETEQVVAVKVSKVAKDDEEFFALEQLQHHQFASQLVLPYLIRLRHNMPTFFMPLADCDAWTFVNLKQVSLFSCLLVMRKLLNLIQEMRKLGICHHDIRVFNLLVFQGDFQKLRLADFSLVCLEKGLNGKKGLSKQQWQHLIDRDIFMAIVTVCSLLTRERFSMGKKKMGPQIFEQFKASQTFIKTKQIFPYIDRIIELCRIGHSGKIKDLEFWKQNFDWKLKKYFPNTQVKNALKAKLRQGKKKPIAKSSLCEVCHMKVLKKNLKRHAKKHEK